jgi:hypothetical protein
MKEYTLWFNSASTVSKLPREAASARAVIPVFGDTRLTVAPAFMISDMQALCDGFTIKLFLYYTLI